MRIILLSGGSGKRLWPLSNDVRSKQFLKLLKAPDGTSESMVQRIVRQIGDVKLDASITIATSVTQRDSIISQLGHNLDIVVEPERRDTFPAIVLAVSHLVKQQHCSRDEVVVVMPSDPYTESEYFSTIAKMVEVVEADLVDMVLMGIEPTHPSSKFGYIVPSHTEGISTVKYFVEKPDETKAKELLNEGALWNGGVFAFRLGYIADIVDKYIQADSFDDIYSRYSELPKISFDYEVVEKASSIGVIPFKGIWSDLGTWNTLLEEVSDNVIGNAILGEKAENTYIINELDVPVICLGTENIIVVASPDGILVSKKESSTELKSYADTITSRPMYEERRWGTYKVMGMNTFPDGYKTLTKLLYLKKGCNISYKYHNDRDEIWTFVDGAGILILDDEAINVERGYVAHIKAGQKHAVRATTDLHIIEVQTGCRLTEDDIIRLDWEWS